jgi:hypothetical protein
MQPTFFNRERLAPARRVGGKYFFESVEAFGEIGQQMSGHLAAHASRLDDARDGNQFFTTVFCVARFHLLAHSTISRM